MNVRRGSHKISIPLLDIRRNNLLNPLLIPPFLRIILEISMIQNHTVTLRDSQRSTTFMDLSLAQLANAIIVPCSIVR